MSELSCLHGKARYKVCDDENAHPLLDPCTALTVTAPLWESVEPYGMAVPAYPSPCGRDIIILDKYATTRRKRKADTHGSASISRFFDKNAQFLVV